MDDMNANAVAPPSALRLGSERLLAMYRQIVLCRTLDERLWILNRQGKAAIVASAQGHEAAQIGSVHALRVGHDHFYIYYRDLAVLVGLGMTPREIMLGFTAKAGEPLAGARQFPTHGASPRHRLINLSNVVGTQIPQAVGSALASKMSGQDAVTIVYFGDGASSVGDCHEAMNFAAVHRLPVIFFCENNGYAISVPLAQQMAVDSVASRAEGYGMPGVVVDGTAVTAVCEATFEAAERARSGGGPTIIEAMVERYLPHTSDDDDSRYRPQEDIDRARERDPVRLLRDELLADGILDEDGDKRIRVEASQQINSATDFIDGIPYPTSEDFLEHVYAVGYHPAVSFVRRPAGSG